MCDRENARGGEEVTPALKITIEDQKAISVGANPQLPAARGLLAETIA